MEPTDHTLLARYVSQGDEAAFALLVSRHGGLIFSLALRKTGNRGLAEEITQNIFALLAQKGAALVDHPALLAWMQKATHYQAERAQAKEFNRQRLLQTYQHTATMDLSQDDDTEALAEHFPMLDAALAELPEPDRQILLLRFWSKSPYKLIAQSLGSSVQACEKRASRALERMARSLRQRGVMLSATAVAAGLTNSSAHAALPGTLSLTPTTLKVVPLMAGWQKLILITLMKTKLTFIAVAILAFGLAGLTGWVAGRNSLETNAAENASVTSADNSPRTGTPTKPVAAESDRLRRVSLETLLQQARDALHKGKIELSSRDLAAAKVSQIDYADIPAALEMIEHGEGFEVDADLTDLVLSRWAEHDGAAACLFSLKLKQPRLSIHPIRHPLTTWAARDPQAAFDWFRTRSREGKSIEPETVGEWVPISNLRWIIGQWALKDPVAAARVIGELKSPSELQGAMVGLGEAGAQAQNRPILLDAVAAKYEGENGGQRWYDIRSLLEHWANVNPEELVKWLSQQQIPKSSDTMTHQPVLKGWLLQEPEKAVAWWLSHPGGHPGRSGKIRDLVEIWAQADPIATSEWLAQQPQDAETAPAIAQLVSKLTQTDPESAFTWAKAIVTEATRKEALSNSLKAWHTKDPAAAKQALTDSSLTDAERTALQPILSQKQP
jgi:RNA polymerase sigma factor (sigma-70 family)